MTRKKGKFRKKDDGVNNPISTDEGDFSEDFPRSSGDSRTISEQPSFSLAFRPTPRCRSASVTSFDDDEISSQILPHSGSSSSDHSGVVHDPLLSLGPVRVSASDESVNILVPSTGRSRSRSPRSSHSSTSVVAERSCSTAASATTRPPELTFQQKILLRERQQKELALRNQQRQQIQNRQAVAQQVKARRAGAEQEKRLSDFHRAEIERLLSGGSSVASSVGQEYGGSIGAEQGIVAEHAPDPLVAELLPAPRLLAELEHLPSLADSGRQLTHLGRTMAPRPGTRHRGLDIGSASRSCDRAQSEPVFAIANPSEVLVLRGEAFARVASASAVLGREDLSKPPPDDHTSDHDEEVFRFRPSEREVFLPKPGNKKVGEASISFAAHGRGIVGHRRGVAVVSANAAVPVEDGVEGRCGGGRPSPTPQEGQGDIPPAEEKIGMFISAEDQKIVPEGLSKQGDNMQAGRGGARGPCQIISQPKVGLLSARTGRPGPKRSGIIPQDDGRQHGFCFVEPYIIIIIK